MPPPIMATHAATALILDTARALSGPLLNVARGALVVLVAYVPGKGDHVGPKVLAAEFARKVKTWHAAPRRAFNLKRGARL